MVAGSAAGPGLGPAAGSARWPKGRPYAEQGMCQGDRAGSAGGWLACFRETGVSKPPAGRFRW
jgi:hypothetical protein